MSTKRTWEKEVVGRYLQDTLEPMIRGYLPHLSGIRVQDEFRDIIHRLLAGVMSKFLSGLEASGFETISKYLRYAFCSYTVSFINAALPEGCLFLIAVVSVQEEDKVMIVVVEREPIARKFVVLNREAYPLFIVDRFDGEENHILGNQMRIMRSPEDLLALAEEPSE